MAGRVGSRLTSCSSSESNEALSRSGVSWTGALSAVTGSSRLLIDDISRKPSKQVEGNEVAISVNSGEGGRRKDGTGRQNFVGSEGSPSLVMHAERSCADHLAQRI